MTRLVRNAKGSSVHRSDCYRLKPENRYPWRWAEDKTVEQLQAQCVRLGLVLCGTCRPLDGWKGPFHACTFGSCECETTCAAYAAHLAGVCCSPGPGTVRLQSRAE